jgi:hypothetical protein
MKSRGLGDDIAKFTCEGRQKAMNALFPYKYKK